ncbi:hypothetical protein [Terriglobus sp.]|uniref:hypothetical protein n=1 Tax=Terriglobus sp. TaxID=1889013 RepID=UPI003B003272
MADLLSSTQEPNYTLRNLLITGLLVALALAAAFGLFYHHENHAPLEATATRVLTLPLHTVYSGHVKGEVGAIAPDQSEDVIYIVPLLRIRNQSDVPLFIKDVTGAVTLQDGRELAGRLIGARDRSRLQQLVPGIAPVLKQANLPALDPEQQVAPNATAEGYAIFLYSIPPTEWDHRQSSNVRLDFYHQDAVTIPLPR